MKKFPKPLPEYRCPLCPDHEDDLFVWSAILKAPICDGCEYELWDAVVCEETRQPDSYILNLLEQHISLSFNEYRLIELDDTIKTMLERPDADQDALCKYKAEAVRLRSVINKGAGA